MDIAALIKRKNNEYLALIRDAQNLEKKLNDKLSNIAQEIVKTQNYYNAKIEEVTLLLDEEISDLTRQHKDELSRVATASNTKKNHYLNSERNRQQNIQKKQLENIAKLEREYNAEIRSIESSCEKQLKDISKKYYDEINSINALQLFIHRTKNVSWNNSNNSFATQIKPLLEKRHDLHNRIEAELKNYKENLKETLWNSRTYDTTVRDNKDFLQFISEYYEVIDEIKDFLETQTAEIDKKYQTDTLSAKNIRVESIEKAEKKFRTSKEDIILSHNEMLKNGTALEPLFDTIDAELRQQENESRNIYKKNISEMNKAAEDAIAQLKQEKNKKINLLNKEKDSLSIQLENARTQNKRNIKAFLERAKREIDDALNTYIDHRVGKKKDFSATNALPEQICVGQHYTKTKSCELSTVLYGSKAVGSSNPILLDVRNNGNIIINASTNDENDEDLYRAVCGLTMKYLEEFPLGALKVHLVDANQHVWFYKIKNAFSNKDSVACKQLITFDSKINSRIESINRDCSEFIMELINGDIQDSYDLYTIDRTHAFHLFVLRSGFSEIVDSGNIETLRLLKNLMGEFGAKCGVRFIIVNDYIENERTDTKKIQLVNDILDSGISVDFEEGKFFANDSEISISYIEEDDADYFIERQCNTMANILGAKKAESLTYDFTNLFANNGRGESSMIDTVLSNWKTSDSTNKLDIPFSILLPAKRPFKVTNLSIGEMGVHALITGMNGSGKSTLLHMLIMSIVSKYDPDDVEIWLLDYGINEFKDYANNRPPHVRFVALEKSQDFTFSFLNYLDKIRMERENLFRGENGVASLKDYRKKHGKLSLPRIVVIMDEFHVMTQHILYNTKYVRSLENALTEGRKYGFSFIFANQTMSGLEGLTTTARDQIGTRIAMNNSISELYYSLELAKMSRVEAFAMKAQVGEFLFRDSNSEIREAKGIYISKETRENLLKAIKNKNIRPRVDANVFVLNGEERLPVPAQDIERNITLYEGPTTRIYLGSPCSIEKECWIDIKARYDENLLVIGKDSMMPDIFLTILYSLVAKPENQLVLVADPYEESLSRYKEANKHLFGNRLRIIDDYEGICDFVKQVREEMRVSRTRVNNMFIFWLGIRDIFTEIQHYSKEKVDNRAIQSGSDIANENAQYDANGNRTSSSKSNSKEPIYVDEDVIKNNAELMAKAREFGLSPEELMGSLVSTNNLSKFNNINSPVINTHVEKASLSNGDCLYNASEDIAQIIAMGSRQRIHSLLHTDSYSAFNMLQIIKKNSFAHVITTEISQEERARWAFPTNSTVLQSGISAQYISGDTTKTFKPYIIDFK